MQTPNLKDCYKFHRYRHHSASDALTLARKDVEAGTVRYASSGRAIGYGTAGQPFKAYGSDHMRWIESLADCGLRFVGYADKLNDNIRHTGWFTDEFQSETVRGCVLQMAGRNKRARFIAAYEDPYNPDTFAADFSDIETGDIGHWYCEGQNDDAIRTVARWADGLAERMAEESREHDYAWQRGREFHEYGEELTELRGNTRALIADIRAMRHNKVCEYPAAAMAVENELDRILAKMKTLKIKRSELLDECGDHDAFKDGANA